MSARTGSTIALLASLALAAPAAAQHAQHAMEGMGDMPAASGSAQAPEADEPMHDHAMAGMHEAPAPKDKASQVTQHHHAAPASRHARHGEEAEKGSKPAMPMDGMDMKGMDMDGMGREGMDRRGMQEPSMSMQHAGHAMPAPAARAGTSNDHVPPPPPQYELPPMSPAHMADMMQMYDKALRGMWLFDRLERRRGTGGDGSTAWSAEGWWGGDVDRLWLKTEGERSGDGTHDARAELLWGHAASTFWDWQLGVRHDFGQGPSRQWVAAGVQGLAPYWFELAATLYAGPQGRTAARFEASYELRFTQRLILSPELELNLYGKDDPRRGIRAGLSEAEAGLRLRYEFSRRFAPYIGIEQTRRFGRFDDVRRHEPARETAWVAGLRFWF